MEPIKVMYAGQSQKKVSGGVGIKSAAMQESTL